MGVVMYQQQYNKTKINDELQTIFKKWFSKYKNKSHFLSVNV